MWKTFVASPVTGGIAAILGWLGAIAFKNSMSEAAFNDLRWGWEGAMLGSIAVAVLGLVWLSSDLTDPPMMALAAAIGGALLWNRQTLPFETTNFRNETATGYWFMFTMMAIVFILLLMGLRAARESNHRAQG